MFFPPSLNVLCLDTITGEEMKGGECGWVWLLLQTSSKAGGWRLDIGGWRWDARDWRLKSGGLRLEAEGWKLDVGGLKLMRWPDLPLQRNDSRVAVTLRASVLLDNELLRVPVRSHFSSLTCFLDSYSETFSTPERTLISFRNISTIVKRLGALSSSKTDTLFFFSIRFYCCLLINPQHLSGRLCILFFHHLFIFHLMMPKPQIFFINH